MGPFAGDPSIPASTRLAWALVAVIAVLLAAALVFFVLAWDTPMPAALFGFRGWGIILGIAFGGAGFLIAVRVPSNPIGWILLLAGAGTALQELALQYLLYGMYVQPGSPPGPDIAAWIVEWIWIPYMATVAFVIPLIYPTGRLPSPRWRPALVAGLAARRSAPCASRWYPARWRAPGRSNPFGIDGATWIMTMGDVVMLVFAVGLLAALASIGIRFRRSQGDERQQLKWLLLALSILACAFLIGVPYWTLSGPGVSLDPVENAVVVALILVPVSIGIAILKYRLYDIDVVIKKTVVYAILAVLLFGLGAAVAWVGRRARRRGAGEGGTRTWRRGSRSASRFGRSARVATRIADRLVFGRRATPYQVLSEFSDRVGGHVRERRRAGPDGAGPRRRPSAPTRRRSGCTAGGFHPGATWPSDASPEDAIPATAIEVRHQDESSGPCRSDAGERPDGPHEGTADPGPRGAGRARAAQRRADRRPAGLARQRLVAAQDEERRRIERNIHDGAQQQLVALAVKLRLGRHARRLGSSERPRDARRARRRTRAGRSRTCATSRGGSTRRSWPTRDCGRR